MSLEREGVVYGYVSSDQARAAVLVKLLMALPQKPHKKQLKGGCNWAHSLGPGDGSTQTDACISRD